MFHRLPAAYNGSMKSRQALKAALAPGLKFNYEVHVLTVIDDIPSCPTTVWEVDEGLRKSIRRVEQQQALASMIAKIPE
jgi:hypothetical protein